MDAAFLNVGAFETDNSWLGDVPQLDFDFDMNDLAWISCCIQDSICRSSRYRPRQDAGRALSCRSSMVI